MKTIMHIFVVVAMAFAVPLALSVTGTEGDGSSSDSMETTVQTPRFTLSGEQIRWQVISSGGRDANSANFTLSGTAGQTATGQANSPSFAVSHGFWQEFGDVQAYVCGDANASAEVDIDDVVYLVHYIFTGGPPPDPLESGDTNCSGALDIDDVVWLVSYIFTGGDAPCDTDGNGVPDC
jgi:hypothetical protein